MRASVCADQYCIRPAAMLGPGQWVEQCILTVLGFQELSKLYIQYIYIVYIQYILCIYIQYIYIVSLSHTLLLTTRCLAFVSGTYTYSVVVKLVNIMKMRDYKVGHTRA